jgi:hypothetical protein
MPSTAAVLGAGLSNVERAAAKKVLSRLDIACQERRGEHDIAADERVLAVIGMDLDAMTRLVERCEALHAASAVHLVPWRRCHRRHCMPVFGSTPSYANAERQRSCSHWRTTARPCLRSSRRVFARGFEGLPFKN